jgi:hypothetical protein
LFSGTALQDISLEMMLKKGIKRMTQRKICTSKAACHPALMWELDGKAEAGANETKEQKSSVKQSSPAILL